jgi:hypothetical protein
MCSAVTALIFQLTEDGRKAPEMFGWIGFLTISGLYSLFLCTGSTIVIIIFILICHNKYVQKGFFLFLVMLGILCGLTAILFTLNFTSDFFPSGLLIITILSIVIFLLYGKFMESITKRNKY